MLLYANKQIEEEMKNKPAKVKARIKIYHGGKYGRTGEKICIIKPEYFKNGNMKTTRFEKAFTKAAGI